MPTLNYENTGALVSYDYLQGTITAVDSANDTADVSGACGELSGIPIFYHCAPDSVARSNGALEGAAGGFAVGDLVVVLKAFGNAASDLNSLEQIELKGADSTATGPKYYVVGHYDGVRTCGIEMIEIMNQSYEWQYWNPVTDSFIDIRGNDGIYRKAYADRRDYNLWCFTLNGGGMGVVLSQRTIDVETIVNGVKTTETLNGVECLTTMQSRCIYCPARFDLLCTGALTNIRAGWFVYREDRPHFWLEIKDVRDGYAIVDDLFPGESYYKSELSTWLFEVNVVFSPYVPLYNVIETLSTSGVLGATIKDESWCTIIMPYASGQDSVDYHSWVACDDRFHAGMFIGITTSPNGAPYKSGVDYRPWIEKRIYAGPGDAYAYRLSESLPCSGPGSAVEIYDYKYAGYSKRAACNALDIEDSPLVFDLLTDTAIDREKVIDSSYEFVPYTGDVVIGCNDCERNHLCSHTPVSGLETRDYVHNGASSPFGGWSESRSQHDERTFDGHVWTPEQWPPLPLLDSYHSSLDGLFSKHTIVSVFSKFYEGSGAKTANWRGENKADTTIGVNPLNVNSPSGLNSIQEYGPIFELVLL